MIGSVRCPSFAYSPWRQGKPPVHSAVLAFEQADIRLKANRLFRAAAGDSCPLTGAGFLALICGPIFFALLPSEMNSGAFASANGEPAAGFVRQNRKAMPFYVAG